MNPTGFTEELRGRCRDRCAFYGDPPCWRLPELVDPCELIAPCQDCIDNQPNPEEEEP